MMDTVTDMTDCYNECRNELGSIMKSVPKSIDERTFLFEHCIGLMMQLVELKKDLKK